ncbi:hypothetical protein [Nostoc sp. PCC 7524]|nr:hypothetical protein [Nostoc sp. PCC 7524]
MGKVTFIKTEDGDSWLDAVRRCSKIEVKLLTAIAKVIHGLIRLDYSFT